jgi:putative heme-binding domain-containing protein
MTRRITRAMNKHVGMKWGRLNFALRAAVGICLITACISRWSFAQQNSHDIPEVVPTSRHEPVMWRYTLDKPTEEWASRNFDDSAWQIGRGGFGTAGTPGIAINTNWSTGDIWLRREFVLPATKFDPSTLQLLAFHDEDIEIFFDGILAARRSGFVTDYQPIEILPEARRLLKPAAKIVVAVHCHQRFGGQGIDVGLGQVSQAWLSAQRKNSNRAFAISNPGDAAAGRTLFLDEQRLACSRCHTTDGSSTRAGPDLQTVGDKFPRSELIDAILHPSANIAVGYSATVLLTKHGDAFVGVVKEATEDHIGVMGGDGKLQRVAAADVRSQRTQTTSLMPEGLEAGLSQHEFADLIEYLVSLRLPAMADAGRAGMPFNIPELRPPVRLIPIHSEAHRFEHPCWIGQVPGEAGTFLVCEHETGRIWRLATGAGGETKTVWGDFRREIRPGGATGLLGVAFHPRFRENRKYYIQHQLVINGRIVARVSEKTATSDLRRDSGTPSRTIIEFPCSTDVHSGGGIDFGPDGFLYIGMGDTGPQGDPEGRGQNLRTMLGKMLRIDVDHQESGNAYAVPADNPFRSHEAARPEIWAYGFREPWRFSFDPLNGDLWVGDVGQDRIEEVNIVRRGESYGWNVYEGFDLFSTRHRTDGVACVPPVFAYNRRLGNSVTGGFVYRGSRESPFFGVYVCGDFTSKRVWGLKQDGRKLTGIWQLCTSPEPIASFGRDEAGALYLVGYDGMIYKLNFTAAASPKQADDPKGT